MRVLVIVICLLMVFCAVCATPAQQPEKRLLKSLPIGIDSASQILNGEYVYVDKTHIILKLIQASAKFVYFSRPRQFGKSLLMSMLQEIFRGQKELFRNTAIYSARTYEWTEHPVVRLNFARIPRNFVLDFLDAVKLELTDVGQSYGVAVQFTPNITEHILLLTRALNRKLSRPVVILIEEYDWTVAHKDPPQAWDIIRNLTRSFYKAIRSVDEIIRFCFITAVPQISIEGEFSGFDEIGMVDISSEPDYSEITGFTIDEIQQNFNGHIEALAEEEKVPVERLYNEIRSWYNKTKQFSTKEVPVYNPHNILTYLHFKNISTVFGNRWGLPLDLDDEWMAT